MTLLAGELARSRTYQPMRVVGAVTAVQGLTLLVEQLPVPIGSLVRVHHASLGVRSGSDAELLGEVVGMARQQAIVMPLGQLGGVGIGDEVELLETVPSVEAGASLLGRIIDGLGRPIDGRGPVRERHRRRITVEPLPALSRRRITEPLHTGVRALDLMTTLGKGQRLGIFAGPGVGKSTLMGQIARQSSAHMNVIGLIGERGREVPDFLEHALGPEGLARSVVVVATGDEPPPMRVRAAMAACAIAEGFRDEGRDVMLMMDSVTRFAHAQRQIGLAVGEPPTTKGYTPSVFAQMALLLERAGIVQGARGSNGGSITGLYTVLVDGDDMTEPVADAARGILDGHLVLSRKLAQRGHYPAIDVLDSISRVLDDVTDRAHQDARRQVIRLLAAYREVEELVQIGAYAAGSNPEADVAIELRPRILAILQQTRDEVTPPAEARAQLIKVALESGDLIQRKTQARAQAASAGNARGRATTAGGR